MAMDATRVFSSSMAIATIFLSVAESLASRPLRSGLSYLGLIEYWLARVFFQFQLTVDQRGQAFPLKMLNLGQ
jgi:hypothetical protein